MSMIWKIYLSGYLVSAVMFAFTIRDKKNRVALDEFAIGLVLSLLSWITVFGLWLGLNMKRKSSDGKSDYI